MSNLNLLVVPVDFSGASEEAVRMPVTIAGPLEAKVHLLHVWAAPVYEKPGGLAFTLGGEGELQRALERRIDEVAQRYRAHEVSVSASVHFSGGSPLASAIVDQAEALGATMLVLGTEGRTGLPRFLLGSVTEKVVRLSPIPVCTVR